MGNDGKIAAAQALTDSTGVSKLTLKKIFKDFIADFLLTAATVLGLDTLNVLPSDQAGWQVFVTGIALAAVKAGYRAVLRWATTD